MAIFERGFLVGLCALLLISAFAAAQEAGERGGPRPTAAAAQRYSFQEEEFTGPAPLDVEHAAAPESLPLSEIDPIEARFRAIEERLAAGQAAAAPKPSSTPKVTVSGVFQVDGVAINQTQASRDTYGLIENGAEFRRARLGAKAEVTDNMNAFMQMDFAFFGRPTFTDLWVDFTHLPVLGNVRVGQWKQPFSLEVVSSFRYTTMMERASTFQAFTPFRHVGIGFYDHSEDLDATWALSYFRTGQDQFGGSLSTDGGNGLAGRLTHLLWYDEECNGSNYLHLGGGYFLNSPPRDTARFRSIPELFMGEFAPLPGTSGTSGQALPGVFNGTPFFVDTGAIADVEHVHTFGAELLWVAGPLSLQAEGMAAVVDQTVAPQATMHGGYITLGYFLTGEHRPYDRAAGAIDRVIPFENFGRTGGWGAWELTSRLSYIDLTEGNLNGGDMQNLTTGLNWYVNPYCKCVFNHVCSWTQAGAQPNPARSGVNSQTHLFGVRCQIDF